MWSEDSCRSTSTAPGSGGFVRCLPAGRFFGRSHETCGAVPTDRVGVFVCNRVAFARPRARSSYSFYRNATRRPSQVWRRRGASRKNLPPLDEPHNRRESPNASARLRVPRSSAPGRYTVRRGDRSWLRRPEPFLQRAPTTYGGDARPISSPFALSIGHSERLSHPRLGLHGAGVGRFSHPR
jgi:hypothetical protein